MRTTTDNQLPDVGRKRGRYSQAFKAKVVARMQLQLSRDDLQATLSLPAHQHAQCAALLKLTLS